MVTTLLKLFQKQYWNALKSLLLNSGLEVHYNSNDRITNKIGNSKINGNQLVRLWVESQSDDNNTNMYKGQRNLVTYTFSNEFYISR